MSGVSDQSLPGAVPGAGVPPWAAPHPAVQLSQRARLEVVFAIMLGLFLSALDQTIVGTALPRIISELHGAQWYTWVVTVYLLTSTISIPIYGKFSDLYGRKPMLMLGIGLFLAGSALCGLSQEMWQLILCRGIQGLGAGAIFPVSLAVIGDLFTPAERGKYQGLFGGVFGIAAIVGPALGGFLTDTISWHWVFYVNMPIGAIALYIIWRVLPVHRREGVSRNLDYLGIAVFAVGIALILVGLTNEQTGTWTDPAVGGLIVAGLAIFGVFLVIERFASEPIVPLGLFRIPTYSISIVATFFASFGFLGAIIFLPFWFQFVRETSATQSGYQMFALLVGMIGSSIISGYLISRTGRYKLYLLVGLTLMAFGLYLMTNLRANTELPMLWLWMFVTGVGMGPTMAAFTIIVQNVLPMEAMGVGTSNLTFFRQIGGAVGAAIAGTIMGDTVRGQIGPSLAAQHLPAQLVGAMGGRSSFSMNDLQVGGDLRSVISAQLPASAQQFIDPIIAGIKDAFSIAVANTFWACTVAAVLALLAVTLLREVPLRRTLHRAAPVPAAPAPVEQVVRPGPGMSPGGI